MGIPDRRRTRRQPASIAPLNPAALWETIAGSISDAVLLVDTDGRIALLNPAAEQLIGRAQKHILGQPCAEVFGSTPSVTEMVARTAATGQAQARNDEIQPRHGKVVPVRLHTAAIWTPNGATIRATAVTIHDLSYQRTLEEDARRSEQLSHLATLVAGLAHEIKNPLGGIKGAAQLLALKNQQTEATQFTDVIVRETNRLTKLVDELLQLGAPRPPDLAPLNVHRVIQDVLGLVAPELGAVGIIVREEFDPSLPDIYGDLAQLTQVLLNVIKNALEAMRGVATQGNHALTITTRMETDFHLVRLHDGSGKFVRIEVADTGPGIAPESRARLFEPFYSTKARGTGIGLAICQRIMAAHHGSIRIGDGAQRGAVVTLNLPLAQ